MLTSVGAGLIQNKFFREERINLVDEQLREAALVLVNSDFADLRKINYEEADQIISEELNEKRIGKFVVVRNSAGEIVFHTANYELLPVDPPTSPSWVSVRSPPYFVRVLNLQLPRRSDRTLQVGAILDSAFVEWTHFDSRFWIYLAGLLLVIGVVAYFSAAFLISPVRKLSGFVRHARDHLDEADLGHRLPPGMDRAAGEGGGGDFFQSLVGDILRLVEEVQRRHRITKQWSYQLAHELKTPLTIAMAKVDRTQAPEKPELRRDLERIDLLIRNFLDWAETDNLLRPRDLHANRVGKTLDELLRGLEIAEGEVTVTGDVDALVFASPSHLEQLLGNLVSNAQKYRRPGGAIEIRLAPDSIEIFNEGPPVPERVLSRIGHPFNSTGEAKSADSHGLGLAWVTSICKVYGWTFRLSNTEAGVSARVGFSAPRGISRNLEN